MDVQGDLPILFILMGILILLALLAALGTWVRGGGLKREDAESLFTDAHDKHREEINSLKAALDEHRKHHEEGLSKTQSDLSVRLRELESVVATATREQGETISTRMDAVNNTIENVNTRIESVNSLISESERRMGQQVEAVNASLKTLNSQVQLAGEEMTRALSEMVRQQREQKAQSTVQLCDALITSLGTLKSSIANQLTQNDTSIHTVDSERVEPSESSRLDFASPGVSSTPDSDATAAAGSWESPFEDLNAGHAEDLDAHADETPGFSSVSPGHIDGHDYTEDLPHSPPPADEEKFQHFIHEDQATQPEESSTADSFGENRFDTPGSDQDKASASTDDDRYRLDNI